MKNVMNTSFRPSGGIKPNNNASLHDLVKRFFEGIKKKCCELSLVNSELTNNKQANDNKVNSPLSWIIASLGQVAHFTSVVIRYVLAISAFRFASAYAKSASWIIRVRIAFAFSLLIFVTLKLALKQGYLLRRVSL